MPIVRFPKFKRSLKLAREQAAKQAAKQRGAQLWRAIQRLERAEHEIVARIVHSLDPGAAAEPPTAPAQPGDPEPPPEPPD